MFFLGLREKVSDCCWLRSCELDRSADIYVAAAVDAAADAAAAYVLVRTFHVDVNTATLVICEAGSSLSLSFPPLIVVLCACSNRNISFSPSANGALGKQGGKQTHHDGSRSRSEKSRLPAHCHLFRHVCHRRECGFNQAVKRKSIKTKSVSFDSSFRLIVKTTWFCVVDLSSDRKLVFYFQFFLKDNF